jgi:hypothetical protein
MADKRDPKTIKPIKGVKIKRREPKEIVKQDPQIIQNVEPPENAGPPTDEARLLVKKIEEVKMALVGAMQDFNKLLTDRKLPQNKSIQENENEQNVLGILVKHVLELEELNPKEGLLSMCVLSLRQSLALRDAGNNMAYRVQELNIKLSALENKIKQIEDDVYE